MIRDTPVTIAAASLLANDSDPNGDPLTITSVSAEARRSRTAPCVLNTQNNTITFTPDAGYTGPASFSYTVSDGRGGTATATSASPCRPPGSAPVSLFTASNTPAQTSSQ